MLEAHYGPRSPRIHASAATARVRDRGASRRLRIGPTPDGGSDALLDLSSRGLKIRGAGPAPQPDAELDVELIHPHLRGPIALHGQVRWVHPESDGTWRAGIEFERLRDTTAVALMQLIVLELGSSVYGERGAVGFVAPSAGRQPPFHVYGLDRTLLATVTRERLLVLEPADGAPPTEHATLVEALAALFPGTTRLRVAPPLG